MANRIKIVQKELMFSLFAQNWSDRKINNSTRLHRKTISRYRKEWLKLQRDNGSSNITSQTLSSPGNSLANPVQSVPTDENKVPTDPELLDKRNISKSKAALYHDEIEHKLQNGQHAVSIYQDLVCEAQYSGSYDSIKRYVWKLKNRTPDLYARIETPPGDEAQVDFGEGAPTLNNGRYRKPWLFVMTLANSPGKVIRNVSGSKMLRLLVVVMKMLLPSLAV